MSVGLPIEPVHCRCFQKNHSVFRKSWKHVFSLLLLSAVGAGADTANPQYSVLAIHRSYCNVLNMCSYMLCRNILYVVYVVVHCGMMWLKLMLIQVITPPPPPLNIFLLLHLPPHHTHYAPQPQTHLACNICVATLKKLLKNQKTLSKDTRYENICMYQRQCKILKDFKMLSYIKPQTIYSTFVATKAATHVRVHS